MNAERIVKISNSIDKLWKEPWIAEFSGKQVSKLNSFSQQLLSVHQIYFLVQYIEGCWILILAKSMNKSNEESEQQQFFANWFSVIGMSFTDSSLRLIVIRRFHRHRLHHPKVEREWNNKWLSTILFVWFWYQ